MRGRRIAVLVFLVGLAGASAQQRTLRMALFQLEPYMFTDKATGEAKGAVVDYWKDYLAPGMGCRVEVVGLFPINRVEKMLESGEIDLAPLFTKVAARESRFLYPSTSFSEVTACLAVKPDSPIRKIEKQEDLFGKRFAFLEGAFLPPFMLSPSIAVELVSNEDYREINLRKLFAGRVDACLDINYASLRFFLKEQRYADKVRLVILPIDPTPIYSIFRRTPDGEKLAAEYDRMNREGREAGVFEKMLDKYFTP